MIPGFVALHYCSHFICRKPSLCPGSKAVIRKKHRREKKSSQRFNRFSAEQGGPLGHPDFGELSRAAGERLDRTDHGRSRAVPREDESPVGGKALSRNRGDVPGFLNSGSSKSSPLVPKALEPCSPYPFSFPKMATALSWGGPPNVWERPRRGFLICRSGFSAFPCSCLYTS